MEVGQRSSGSTGSSLSQINVTPFVDVMLVLLVIFMVTAPMMDKGVEVELPQVEQAPNLESGKEPLIVTLDRAGNIFVGKSKVSGLDQVGPVLQQVLKGRKDTEVYLEADNLVPYGKVVQLMAAIKKSGVERLGMVAEEPSP